MSSRAILTNSPEPRPGDDLGHLRSSAVTSRRIGFRGYVTCREFGGLRIPVPVQTHLMRDYAKRQGLTFMLHENENLFPGSYMVLEGLLANLDGFGGLFATSLYMMPQRKERRMSVYRRIIEQGAELHFILENLILRTQDDIAPLEEILIIHNLLDRCPKSIDLAAP